MRIWILFIGLLGLALAAPIAGAAEPPCTVTATHPLIGGKSWYGLYYEDDKIGHAVIETVMDPPDDEHRHATIVQHLSLTFKVEQTEETASITRRFDGRPPHRLIDGIFETADRRIDYDQEADGLRLNDEGVGRIWTGIERTFCDEEDVAMHSFLSNDPPVGARLTTEDFSVDTQTLFTSTHDLKEVSRRRVLGAEHVFHTIETVTSDGSSSERTTNHFRNGKSASVHFGPFQLRAETEAIAHQPNRGVDLFAEFEKPLNRALTRLPDIETLVLKASIDEPSLTIDQVVRDGYGQRVEYIDDGTALVRIADAPAPADEAEHDYLRSTSMHPADHPRLQAMVEEIREEIGSDVDYRGMAAALIDFVSGYIETVPESPYHYNTTSVFDILDNRIGDCTEHSQLFVTLARAAGLPAREVSGFVYGGDHDAPSLGGHAWVEVMIDGAWIGMDPTWEETELNRSHVQTWNDFVPSLAFEVVDIVYR